MNQLPKTNESPPLSRVDLGLTIYALITTSVVLASADNHTAYEVGGLMVGQGLALTLAHSYTKAVSREMTLWAGIMYSLPVFFAALPAATVAAISGIAGADGESAVYSALGVNLVLLVVLQGLATRRIGFTWSRLAGAVVLDAVAIVIVIAIVKLLK